MAPIPEAYFPSLDKCFSGDAQLFSWERAFLYVNDLEGQAGNSDNVEAFLTHPETTELLSQSLSPFARPSAKSKSEFDSKTAAIHVEPNSKTFDLKEIKADAQWLSQQANIDEITALRITVLEWQNRPAKRLTTSFSSEEVTSVQNATGVDNHSISVAGPNLANILRQATENDNGASFDSESHRRLRIRHLYLSERSHILKTFRKLLVLSLHKASDETSSVADGTHLKVSLRKVGASLFEDKSTGDALGRSLELCINSIRGRLEDLQKSNGWLTSGESSEEIECAWRTTLVDEIVHILQIMFHQLHASAEIPSGDILCSWLDLMSEYQFFKDLQVFCDEPTEVLLAVQAFVSLTTISFLKLPLVFASITGKKQAEAFPSGQKPYFLSKDRISQITEIFTKPGIDLDPARPAALAWGLILHAIQQIALEDKHARDMEQFHNAVDSFQSNNHNAHVSRGSEITLFEELVDCAPTPKYSVEQAVNLLTSHAMKDSSLDILANVATMAGPVSAIDDILTYQSMRLALLDVVRVSVVFYDYSTELVASVLAILDSAPNTSLLRSAGLVGVADPISVFIEDNLLMENVFRTARSRFPYESLPFLKLCRALISKQCVNEDGLPRLFDELEGMETFTQIVPRAFQGYRTIREDENQNFVSLIQSLPMFEAGSRNRLPDIEASSALIVKGSSEIPAATEGQIISENKPPVIMWHHQYSCLSFLGSWLEEWSETGGYSAGWDIETGTEIIGLLANLVANVQDLRPNELPGAGAKRVLEMASDGLSRQGDIITVIFDIFERNLQNIGSQSDPARAIDPIMACVHFVRAVLKVLPCRVWPFFSRSSLVGSDGKGGMMTVIISAAEMPSGEYPFLLSCVDLFKAVVDDTGARAVLRRSPGSVAGKSTIATDWSASIPSHMMRTILLNFTRTMVDIFNSNGNWRFNLSGQQFEINAKLAATFSQILHYAYGANDSAKLESKVTGVFSSSATYILDMLRPRSVADLPFNPLLTLIAEGLQTPSTLHLRYLALVQGQVTCTLNLCVKILQASRLAGLAGSLLEEQLFKAVPVLVKLYASNDAYKLPIVALLEILISSAASNSNTEPPSLVGHLGAEAACLFLDVLSQLDKPSGGKNLLLAVWRLLSTFVSRRQQWLAVFILTGASPRQSLKKTGNTGGPSMRGVPFLQRALDRLAHIDQEEPEVALEMLEFVSRAQENWPWATPQLKNHPQFLTGIVNHVSKLKISSLPVKDQIFVTRIAAVVADICAVYLHAAKESNDRSFVKTLIPLVQWYAKDAVNVSGYNASLHTNLKKNFEARYSGCKLNDFKRTPLVTRTMGRNYYYDIEMGQELLSYDFAWAGTRGQGFSEEFERANFNLSLVEAQVSLLNSWKFFAVEHCADFMPEREIQRSMAVVAQHCLEANSRGVPPEAIFERIQQTRVDFAQALLQRLVQVGSRGSEVFAMLEVTWKAILSRHSTYEDALISDDTDYYRSLLNVLFLALQFHLGTSRGPLPAGQNKAVVSSDLTVVVEIVKTIVAQGFKSLTTYLHEQPEKCTPKDFGVIIAILQSALHVKDADRLYEHITYHIEDNDTARNATTLFSWADQLLLEGDPVYGDLSMSILVKMSTIPMLAEHIAVEGVLMKLSTCRLTNLLRQPKGFGPFDPVPRLYSIWNAGFLPLCLNLLYNVVRTAPEVVAFLNQFEAQLNRAAEVFASPHAGASVNAASQWITLGMASEAYSLALISFILDGFRQAGPSAGLDPQSIQELKWDKAQVKDDIEALLSRRQILRARIVPTNDKETELSRQKPIAANSLSTNRLEEKVVGEMTAALSCLGGDEDS